MNILKSIVSFFDLTSLIDRDDEVKIACRIRDEQLSLMERLQDHGCSFEAALDHAIEVGQNLSRVFHQNPDPYGPL